jgi:diguanylate cyclase (GGDEF)-like protein
MASNHFKIKLYMLLTALLLLTMLITLSLSFYFSHDQQVKQLQSQIRQTVEDKTGHLGEWISGKIILLEMVEQGRAGDKFLPEGSLTRNGISDIYAGFEDGTFTSYTGWMPPSNYDPRIRPWYRTIKESGQLTISDPYLDMKTSSVMVSLGWPILENGKIEGIIAEDIPIMAIVDKISKLNFSEYGFVWILNESGIFVYHPNPDVIYKNIQEVSWLSGIPKVEGLNAQGETSYSFNGSERLAIYGNVPNTQWTLGVTVMKNQVINNTERLRLLYLILALILSCIFAFMTYLLTRILAGPLLKIIEFVKSVAEGDLEQRLEIKFNREIDDLAVSLNEMAQKLKHNFMQIEEQNDAMSLYTEQLEGLVSERTQEIRETNDKLLVAYKNLEIKATTDYLTGIANRSHFFDLATLEISRSFRDQHTFCVLIADLDNFKLINDDYGHMAGDAVLVNAAEMMQQALRDYDLIGRLGGEEFVMLLPETTLEQGLLIGERMRKSVEEGTILFEGDTIGVTVSIGITTNHTEEKRIEEILSEADQALYEAKGLGKNRIIGYRER